MALERISDGGYQNIRKSGCRIPENQDIRLIPGGSLKRSLGMTPGVLTIPKAFGIEAATLATRVFLPAERMLDDFLLPAANMRPYRGEGRADERR